MADISLTNQTFQEAGGKEIFPNLELLTVVIATQLDRRTSNLGDFSLSFENINKELSKKAASLGATHVFNVSYENIISPDKYDRHEVHYPEIAYGSAYAPKQQNSLKRTS